MDIKELIEKHGNSNENWLILEFLTGKKAVELKMELTFCVDSIYNEFLEIIEKRKQNYPLQYIFGRWEFYGLELFVDESALIPRFETEILVDEILKLDCKKDKILDIGCGSGAISIALADNLKKSYVYGIDISKEAIKLSNKNKEELNLKNVEFFESDIFSNIKEKNFDIIVSNPPFFKVNRDINFLNNLKQLSIARHEIEITLEELIKISSELIKDRGYFYLVHRADRLSEILCILEKYKFGVKKIKFCYTTKYKNAKIVLIEAIKNGKTGLTVLPSLIINKENGEYTDEVLKMFE